MADRASKILEVCRNNTGQDMTIMELAELCGGTPGKSFGLALAQARHLALDNDEVITPCIWNPKRRAQTLKHLMPAAENGEIRKPLMTREQDVATRLRNIGRLGHWANQYAEEKVDRLLGKAVEDLATSAEKNLRTIGQLAKEIKNTNNR